MPNEETAAPGIASDAAITGEQADLTDGAMPPCAIRELMVSDRDLMDQLLDHFSPGWESGSSGSLTFMTDSSTFAFGAFLVDDDGNDTAIAGYTWGYRLRLPTGARSILVHDIEVDQQLRCRGIGGHLVQAVLDLARREGHQHVWAVVEGTNDLAKALARSAGGVAPDPNPGDLIFEWRLGR